jgi:hypothetical protein
MKCAVENREKERRNRIRARQTERKKVLQKQKK